MEIHDRWATTSFDLEPVSPRTGPFVRRQLLGVWWRHQAGDGELRLLDSGDGLVPLCWFDGAVRFVGEADLIDYHSPLGAHTSELIASYVSDLEPGTPLHFDSLPQEAATALAAGFATAGLDVMPVQHDVTAVLALPDTFELWLESLTGKQRHEVRRKLRRFETAGGAPGLTRQTGADAVATFSKLHRKAHGDKGRFMTEEIEAFFGSLHQEAGAVIDVLEGPAGTPVAAAFGFEDDDTYYLYNSGFDPAASSLSPGIVMLAALVERAIRSGKQVFDFLKGGEMYKFRHGAQPRPLYEIQTVTGGSR